jgi:hypothetical protein
MRDGVSTEFVSHLEERRCESAPKKLKEGSKKRDLKGVLAHLLPGGNALEITL